MGSVFFFIFFSLEDQIRPVAQKLFRILLGQWLNFKLFGITYLVGKIKFTLFFQGPLAE